MSSRPAKFAARYCELGLALVPVPRGEKGPRHRGWNDPANAIADPHTATEYWSDHPGLGMAALLEPSQLVSLDVDDEEIAGQVLDHLGVDLEALRATAPTITGRHCRMIFRAPADALRHRSIAWPKREGPGSSVILELRAGMIADTLPPSKHPTAGEYRWTRPPREGFPALPARLLDLWFDWDSTRRTAMALCPWYTPPKSAAPREPKQIRPGESVIAAFNVAHEVVTILEAHGYVKRGRRLASPETGHAAGITLLDDGRAYCHHQGDALATGRALDAFDAFRILDHAGDYRAAVKAAADALGLNQRRVA